MLFISARYVFLSALKSSLKISDETKGEIPSFPREFHSLFQLSSVRLHVLFPLHTSKSAFLFILIIVDLLLGSYLLMFRF